jgi:undecaprenyl-diphosphatase
MRWTKSAACRSVDRPDAETAPAHRRARHLSAADERFGLRLGAGLDGTLAAAVTFALLLLLVRAGWAPLRRLDTGAAEAFNRIDALSRR